jgi:hypothetical protein
MISAACCAVSVFRPSAILLWLRSPTATPASTIRIGAPRFNRSSRFAASDLTTMANAAARSREFMCLIFTDAS